MTRWQSRLPAVTWESSEGKSEEQLLATVDEGEIDCTLAESTLVAANRRIHHHLRVAFDASGPRQVVWLVRKDNEQLAEAVQSWFQKVRANGLLSALEDRTFAHLASYDLRDLEVFQRRIVKRLPAYRELFEAAAHDVGLPWTLLAAQAYQESHWDADATSPTGVKGIMMLTRSTAKSLGVVDRTDPRQSIPAGAHYLRQLLDSLPQESYRRDRVNQALAAYTIGLKHVRKARRLSANEGKDPRLWSPVKHSLLQLSQQTQEGHSAKRRPEGKVAVRYVHRIRNYEDVLRHSVDMSLRRPSAHLIDSGR